MIGRQNLLQALFDVLMFFQAVFQFCEHLLRLLPVVGFLFCDIDAVPFGSFVVLLVQEEFFVELLSGAETGVDDLLLAGAVELDHLGGQVPDSDRFAHVQDEEFVAFGDGNRLENKGSRFRYRHEVTDDIRTGNGHRTAGTDLALEDRDDRAVGAQDVAETDRHEFGIPSRDGGDNDLRQALGGAHDIGGVHRFVGGYQDKALYVAFHCDLGGFVSAEDVVENRLFAAELHQGNVLVGGGVDHDIRLVLAHDPPEGFLVPDGTHFQHDRIGDQFTVFLLQFEEKVVHVVFADVVEHQFLRSKGKNLAAEFRADGASASGNENRFSGHIGLDFRHVQMLLGAAQQVGDVQFPGFGAFPGAGVKKHVTAGGDAPVQEVGNLALRGRDGDDDFVDTVFLDGVLQLIDAADHGYPGNGGVLFLGIVVEDGDGYAVAVASVLDVPDHGSTAVAGADNQDLFCFFVFVFGDTRTSVPDQEAAAGDQGQGDDPLDEIDRAGHQDEAEAELVFVAAVEEGDHEADEVSDAGTGQGGDDALEEGVGPGVAEQGFIDPGDPEGGQGGGEKQGERPAHLGHADGGNA